MQAMPMMSELAEPGFATSSQHWYRLDGSPAYTVIGKNGKERATTLRDARSLQLVPSVTTIIRMAAAPALEKWKRDQVLLAALTLPQREGEPEAEWLKRVEQDWQEQGRKAADKGTRIHTAIEQHFRDEQPDEELWDWVKIAKDELLDRCGAQAWKPERSFAHPSGYGGKTDLHSDEWVIDIKTKDGDPPSALYDEHLMQLAAYRMGLGVMNARCAILFVSRDHPSARLVEPSALELIQGENMFMALLAFWQAKTGHRPRLKEAA